MKRRKLAYGMDPLAAFQALSGVSDFCYLLESSEGPRELARYSFIGFSPSQRIKVRNGRCEVTSSINGSRTITCKDPFLILKKLLSENATSDTLYRFTGGLVGYISYEAVRYLESIPTCSKDDLGFPDLEFGLYDDGIIFDHLNHQAYYYWYEESRFEELEPLLDSSVNSQTITAGEFDLNLSRREFVNMVRAAKRYIRAGDILQVVLSKRYECAFKGDLVSFYRRLREINPSPYMYFLKMGDRAIVGSSPEMLGRVEAGRVETFPIAGTRPIVPNEKDNKRLAAELLKDPKERAEHVMLTDLARNDVGKVCSFGTVHVPEFMKVQRYSHVQHIVSRVSGKLRSGIDAVDAFKSIFPAGTVSGAPKKRAMEIIEELEPSRRGPYAGSVGYFSFNGNADFAITIRTLITKGDRAFIQAGAGIVADSKPDREWFETEHKTRALLKALEVKPS